jgi:uncharacterized SAM-binding protein YcdF (DUF218 family)
MKLFLKTALLFIMSLFTIWLAGFLWFNTELSLDHKNMQAYQGNLPKADAIVVLTGSNERINAGLSLYAQEAAPLLFISGVHPQVKTEDITRTWNEEAPLPSCCIELGYSAENTQGNALETIKWIQGRSDINSIFLVTDEYHMERSKLEFSFVKKDLKIHAYPVESNISQAGFIPYMRILLKEYHKTVATYFRHLFIPDFS